MEGLGQHKKHETAAPATVEPRLGTLSSYTTPIEDEIPMTHSSVQDVRGQPASEIDGTLCHMQCVNNIDLVGTRQSNGEKRQRPIALARPSGTGGAANMIVLSRTCHRTRHVAARIKSPTIRFPTSHEIFSL